MKRHVTFWIPVLLLFLSACDSNISEVDAPLLLSPPDGAMFAPGEVLLSWQPVDGAEAYLIEISPVMSFQGELLTMETTQTSGTTQPLDAGTYYWRAYALADNDRSDVSEVRSFVLQ